MLIETDLLLAALNKRDPLHVEARKVLALPHLLLSPYSLLELNLLVRAERMKIRDFDSFARKLLSFFTAREIRILPDTPSYHSTAREIELGFHLTFFDSLHAAVAKREGQVLVSFDSSYERLRSIGIKHLDPRDV